MIIPNARARSGLRLRDIGLCIGVLSDTTRLPALPEVLFDVFDGVDLILHGGDVGGLWIMDDLSEIAPTIGVRGREDRSAFLASQQIVALGGRRVLLYHREREGDAWMPLLRQRASDGQAARADIVIFGGLHIPLVGETDGVLLLSPGALGPLDDRSRQVIQTVAVLTLSVAGEVYTDHVDLANPAAPFDASIDREGIRATAQHYSGSIMSSDLVTEWSSVHRISRQVPEIFAQAMQQASEEVWRGDAAMVTRQALLAILRDMEDLSGDILAEFTVVLTR